MGRLFAVDADAALSASAAAALNGAVDWWKDVNESPMWQDRIFHVLAVLYGIVSVVALRIVSAVHCVCAAAKVQLIQPEILQHVILDMPGLALFTTYMLLVLFWVEIYYQARAISTDGLRPTLYWINAVVYAIQIMLLENLEVGSTRTVVVSNFSKMVKDGVPYLWCPISSYAPTSSSVLCFLEVGT